MGGSENQVGWRERGVAVSPKTRLAGQASGKWRGRLVIGAATAALSAILAACGEHVSESEVCADGARTSAISGYCVPRYVSLKRDTVFARKGPGADYPALWIYHARGLPVQIVGETLEWRRICDPDGGAVWVHRAMVDGRRAVQARPGPPVPLRHTPGDKARLDGFMKPRALATLDRCLGGWCRISVSGVGGWAPADRLWGVEPRAQCR